jgi:UDP-perosamine 4-acetyltransferase
MAEAEDLILVGAGGHAKVVLELVRASERFRVIGCVDPGSSGDLLGVPVIGSDAVLPDLRRRGVRHAFVALGANDVRMRVTEQVRKLGFIVPAIVSPNAVVSPTASIQPGAVLMAGVTVNALSVIGEGAIVNTNASVDHDCVVGPFAHCAPGTHLAGNVDVGEGAFLGVGACAIPGTRIGAWSTVGAGGIVIDDIPAGVTAVGVPARILSRVS